MVTLPLVLIYLMLINLLAFLYFWIDKRRAVMGNSRRRIPESELLGLAFIGGSPGAMLARHLFRHKTRKQPFATYLDLIAGLHLCCAVGLVIFLFP